VSRGALGETWAAGAGEDLHALGSLQHRSFCRNAAVRGTWGSTTGCGQSDHLRRRRHGARPSGATGHGRWRPALLLSSHKSLLLIPLRMRLRMLLPAWSVSFRWDLPRVVTRIGILRVAGATSHGRHCRRGRRGGSRTWRDRSVVARTRYRRGPRRTSERRRGRRDRC